MTDLLEALVGEEVVLVVEEMRDGKNRIILYLGELFQGDRYFEIG